MPIHLLDLSNNQPNIPAFPQLKADGIDGVLHKASQGSGFTDGYLSSRWKGIAAAGLVRGSYHFYDNTGDPATQATHYINVMKSVGVMTGDLLALDMEELSNLGPGDHSALALTWGRAIAAEFGVKPLLYSDLSYFQEHLTDPALVDVFAAWVAAWGQREPGAPKPFKTIALWQNSASASFPGLPNVDEDTFMGTVAELRALGKPAPVPPRNTPTDQEKTDAAWIGLAQHMLTGIPVVNGSAVRSKFRAWLKTHPA